MTALSFIHLSQKHVARAPPTIFYSKPRSEDEDEDLPRQMVSILSWIATCLVRDAQGDAVAAALSVLSGTITLFLSRTRGPPDEQDITNSREFLSALRQAMAETDANQATDILFKTAVSISYRRFASKVSAIAGMEKVGWEVSRRFNSIVDNWVAWGGTENDVGLFNFAHELGLSTETHGPTALKLVFGQLVNWIEKGLADLSSGVEKYMWAQAYGRFAVILVHSSFFKQFGRKEGSQCLRERYGAADATWILKLWRRLWRVARYRVDAWSFATYGFHFIRDALGARGLAEFLEAGKNMEVNWVAAQQPGILPHNHGHIYALPEPPLPLLSSTLEKYGFGRLELDETKPEQQEFADSVRSLWPAGGAVPHLHCEIQLISFFEQNDTLPVHKNYIGVSKLSCWACHAYIEQVNKQRAEPWTILGTSNKANYAWLIPSNPSGLSVVDLIRDKLKEALANIAETYGTRMIGDDGSSSGSDESQSPYI